MDIKVNGSGYASDIFKDIVASFDILQKGNITILSKKCLMEPLEPDYMVYLFIGMATLCVNGPTDPLGHLVDRTGTKHVLALMQYLCQFGVKLYQVWQ